MDNLLTIPKFAALKGVERGRINYLINNDAIIPEVIAGVKFINVDIYKDFDVNARIAKDDELDALKKKINKLEGQNKEFGKQLNALKNMIMPDRQQPSAASQGDF